MTEYSYYIIGFLIVANFGTILSIVYFGGKCVWFISSLKAQVDRHEKQLEKLELKGV